ncbi:MAG: transposase [Stigonema ocellatum SAG 48.90 = DSM 106950]|nr:transposase [Stigonema ocellatum SAG 48.90 = DSM 106950]
MQVRWNFKMLPNQSQEATLEDWLVTLRKHRNYALRERKDGFETNNQDVDTKIAYAYGAYCDLDSRAEYGSSCPLTCPVLKHGVIPQNLELATKQSKVKDKVTKEVIGTRREWDSASGIQMKVTSQIRQSLDSFAAIDSCVLQRNIAKLDTAYANFWKQGRGFPQFLRRLDSFEYKPGRVILRHIRKNYATAYLPGIGEVKFHNSRDLSIILDLRTCTIKREASTWYISMLVEIPGMLPELNALDSCKSVVGIDVGITKLVALSDGSFIENKRFATNKRKARRLAMRQRAIARKQKGSNNRTKAVKKLAKQQHRIAQQRDGYNWQVASTIVKTADAVAREDLKIKNMVKRAKPKHDGRGGYKRNGASQKTGLNRVIVDAGWGDIFNKIAWLAVKTGKPVIVVPAKHSSQECPQCGHIDSSNREGEKFLCTQCGYTEHADTKASRTLAKRAGLVFPKNKKILPPDWGKVTLSRYQPIVVETGNQASGNHRHVRETPTVGYVGDTAETLTESPCL